MTTKLYSSGRSAYHLLSDEYSFMRMEIPLYSSLNFYYPFELKVADKVNLCK